MTLFLFKGTAKGEDMTTEKMGGKNDVGEEDWLTKEIRKRGGIEKIPTAVYEQLLGRCSYCGLEKDAEAGVLTTVWTMNRSSMAAANKLHFYF